MRLMVTMLDKKVSIIYSSAMKMRIWNWMILYIPSGVLWFQIVFKIVWKEGFDEGADVMMLKFGVKSWELRALPQ